MPELPEVETLRRSLQGIQKRSVLGVYLSKLAPVEATTASALRQVVLDATIIQLNRWGKYLLIDLDNEQSLVVHLGMSGKLLWQQDEIPVRPLHTHMELNFDDGSVLRFIDARRFGTLSLTNRQRDNNPFLARLGPDYLNGALDEKIFLKRCHRHPKVNLKTLLLNQKVATGLGNIYACEALYQAGLDPCRLVSATNDQQLVELLIASKDRLKVGVKYGGTSFRDYLNGLGHRGKMKDFLQVYDREGQLTLDGRGTVQRIVQQQRSTFYCPEVQK